MLMLSKILVVLLVLLTIRAIVPRYKVDILITVVWKQLLVLSMVILLYILN